MELIYKDALLKELGVTNEDCEKCAWGDGYGYCTRGSEFTDACDAICTAPVIEERKGKWIWQWDKFDIDTANEAVCSKCKKISAMPVGYFCKWCGADMREQP